VAQRGAAAIVGVVFGLTLSWTGLISPDVIRSGLLFEDPYLMLVFAAALAVAFVGTQVLRLTRPRALLTGERVEWAVESPQRRQLGGAALFGTGWAIAGACPGPVAAQLGQGVVWSLFTAIGVTIGIVLFLRLGRRARHPFAGSGQGTAGGDAHPAHCSASPSASARTP
jgi:uncharacterized protein